MFKTKKKVLVCSLVFAASHPILCGSSVLAATAVEAGRVTGVWCERKSDYAITKAHEALLTQSLRRVTGFGDLHFASNGVLDLGDPRAITGGSLEARNIMISALRLGAIFIIEDYSRSALVNFGQAAQAEVYAEPDGGMAEVWRLRLDFEDFQNIQASAKVRAAFDEGFTLLHELLHGLGYRDASSGYELGECEEIVNRMRRELDLPLREQYFGESWRITDRLTSVRLRFRSPRREGSAARSESHYLFFLVAEPVECSADVRGVTRVQKRAGTNSSPRSH